MLLCGKEKKLVYNNIMFVEQSFQSVDWEDCFFDFGSFRIDGVVVAGAEIGLEGDGLVEFRTVEVAVVEEDFGQVGGHEIYSDEAAVGEGGTLYL